MASLVLGAAGAVVGGMMFGPVGASIGWGLGSAAGSYLDPPKTSGPRLTDLKLQSSQYGQMIPYVYGTDRISGQVMWQSDLTEHKSTKRAGKGGGGASVTTYTYSASFAILLCQGPIAGVVKVWADGRVIYDGAATAAFPFTLYLGDELQLPDPTMEAALGAGNVPAHRGLAYLVVKDLDLAPYGNRLPVLSFLVSDSLQHDIRRVTTWPKEFQPQLWARKGTEGPSVAYDGSGITFGWVEDKFGYPDPHSGIFFKGGFTYRLSTYSETGELIADYAIEVDSDYARGGGAVYKCKNRPGWFWHCTNEDPFVRDPDTWPLRENWGTWWDGGGPVAVKQLSSVCGAEWVTSWDHAAIYMLGSVNHDAAQGTVPGSSGGVTLRRFEAGGFHSALPTYGIRVASTLSSGAAGEYTLDIDTDGTLWVTGDSPTTPAMKYVLHVRDTGTELEVIDEFDGDLDGERSTLFIRNAMFCSGKAFTRGYKDLAGYWQYRVYDLTTAPPWHSIAEIQAGVHEADAWPYVPNLGGGLAFVQDGLCSICTDKGGATTVATIVGERTGKIGLVAGQFDVGELGDSIDGFKIASQMTGRAAIEHLMTAYYFDAVESDGAVKFVKRGKGAVVTIADDELGAFMGSDNPPALIQYTRAQEADLPLRINVTYEDLENDYQAGSVPESRQSSLATIVSEIQLSVVMSKQKAREIAQLNLFNAWIERDRATIYVPRKYAYLDPTDVIVAGGLTWRIAAVDAEPYGRIKLDLRRTQVGAWSGGGSGGNNGDGNGPTPGGATYRQQTPFFMLDLPYIDDKTRQEVYWSAMCGADRADWPGATLFKSNDGGTNFVEAALDYTGDTIGLTQTILRHHPGGNVFDEGNAVTVKLWAGAGELESISRDAVLLGGNEAVIGHELIQFRDAVLVDASTYTLTGLLRGRRGTQWAMGTHTIGERFVLLPASARISAPRAEYGMTTQWKAVTSGNALLTAVEYDFRSAGMSVLPYSPVQLGAGLVASGDWLLTWRRRARLDGEWMPYVDVPLDETDEMYHVNVYTDAAYRTIAGQIDAIPGPYYQLSAALQTAWFGAPQSSLYWSVAQIGRIGPGFDSNGRAPILIDKAPYPAPGVPGTNVPPVPPLTGVPQGTPWHDDFVFTGSTTNAQKNFNYLMATYGSSWALGYLYGTDSNLRSDFSIALGDPTEANRVINTMGGAGVYSPPGFIIPWGLNVIGISVGHPTKPLALTGFVGGLANGRTILALPYPDDDN